MTNPDPPLDARADGALSEQVVELGAENARLLRRLAALGSRLAELEQRQMRKAAPPTGMEISSFAAALVKAVASADRAMAVATGEVRFVIAELECELPGIVTSTTSDVFFRPAHPVIPGGTLATLRMRIAKVPHTS